MARFWCEYLKEKLKELGPEADEEMGLDEKEKAQEALKFVERITAYLVGRLVGFSDATATRIESLFRDVGVPLKVVSAGNRVVHRQPPDEKEAWDVLCAARGVLLRLASPRQTRLCQVPLCILAFHEFSRPLAGAHHGFNQSNAQAAFLEFQETVDGAAGRRGYNVL